MNNKHFRSMKQLWEKYFPRKVELKRLEIKTPREFGERIVAEILGDVKELLEEDK